LEMLQLYAHQWFVLFQNQASFPFSHSFPPRVTHQCH
jgi:hypothetical protein